MEILHKIKMDLVRQGISPRIPVVQGDAYSRKLVISLFADKKPWRVPQDASIVIRYLKPDRTSGAYDTLADGTPAVSVSGNNVSILVAPEALNLSGLVSLMVTILQGERRLSTFAMDLAVQSDCVSGMEDQEGAAWIAAFLPSPQDAQPGHYLSVETVDEKGHVLSVKAEPVPEPDGDAMEEAVARYLEKHDISGQDGLTPSIGDNGNWWIGNTDTGVPATAGGQEQEAVVLEELTATGFATATVLSPVILPATLDLQVGQVYTVAWDGTVYRCVCLTGASAQGTTILSPYLGNPGILLKETGAVDYPDTGENFLILDNGDETVIMTATEGDHHTIAIYTGGLTSIVHGWNGTVLTVTSASGTSSADLKGEKGDAGPRGETGAAGQDGLTPFIGENGNWWIGSADTGTTAGGASGLPAATADDNGKFLRVVDGAWAAVAVDMAEEASF